MHRKPGIYMLAARVYKKVAISLIVIIHINFRLIALDS